MKTLIIANWKMNPASQKEAISLFKFYSNIINKTKDKETVVCPPFIYLSDFLKFRKGNLKLGAQDLFWEKEQGAYTGEISPLMLKNLKCEYVILGHSERRINLNETNEIINKKIKSAVFSGIKAVFCIGENNRDAEHKYYEIIKEQIEHGLYGISKEFIKNIIIAYEPVWAISANQNAEAIGQDDLLSITAFIRKTIMNIYKDENALRIPILYGGSVNSENFNKFIELAGLSGFLIGGASLKPKELKKILTFTKFR